MIVAVVIIATVMTVTLTVTVMFPFRVVFVPIGDDVCPPTQVRVHATSRRRARRGACRNRLRAAQKPERKTRRELLGNKTKAANFLISPPFSLTLFVGYFDGVRHTSLFAKEDSTRAR